MKIKDIFFSWDFGLALATAFVLLLILPKTISCSFAKDMSSIAISVLAIVFSVFFAALAIIISSGNDDFIIFIDKEGIFDGLMGTFKSTIGVIFCSLILFLFYYGTMLMLIENQVNLHSKWFFLAFGFLFAYSMFASFNACLDALTFSKYRLEFLKKNE